MKRLSSDAGIAIAPILFVIALLALLATVIAAGTGDFNTATVADRSYNDLYSQANLIRAKINECNLKYGTNNNGDGYPPDTTTPTAVCALTCLGDPNTAETGNDCQGNPVTEQNLWEGIRPALLPPPTTGFNQWYYTNAGTTGGRCIWTQPSGGASGGILAGLAKTASRFSSQEVIYNPSGSTERLVIWITIPTGVADSHCTSS
jgi:type II secretory pathway pseudopilin PulG